MTIVSRLTPASLINPGLDGNVDSLALKRLFDKFAPKTGFDYVQSVDLNCRTIASNCWDSCLNRAFFLNRRPVGCLCAVLLKSGSIEIAANNSGHEDLLSILMSEAHTPSTLAEANNTCAGSELFVAQIFWDISLGYVEQMAILRGMSTHVQRFFAGNVVKTIYIQALEEFSYLLKERGYSSVAPADPNTNLSVWKRYPVTTSTNMVEDSFALQQAPLLPPGNSKKRLTNHERLLLRYLYEYDWKKEEMSRVLKWSDGVPLEPFKSLRKEARRYFKQFEIGTQFGNSSALVLRAWLRFVDNIFEANGLPRDFQERYLVRMLARSSGEHDNRYSFDKISED